MADDKAATGPTTANNRVRGNERFLRANSPAMDFADGFPVGNGRIGAMVFGGPARMVFVINHFDLYWRPEAQAKMRRGFWAGVRRMFRGQQWRQLRDATNNAFAGWGRTELGSFQPAAILEIWPELPTGATNYERWMDLNSGTVGMSCRIGRRRLSLSVRTLANVPAFQIGLSTTLPDGLTARVRLYRPFDARFVEPAVDAATDCLTLRHGWDAESTQYEVAVKLTAARFDKRSLSDQPHRAAVMGGHSPTVHHPDAHDHAQAQGIVRGTGQLHLHVAVDVQHGQTPRAAAILRRRSPARRDAETVAALKRASLELPGGDSDDPTAPAHFQRRWRIGRHLFTSATFPGGWPPNLQGIWNDRSHPVCNSDYHLDLNLQMAMWHVPTGNLLEYHDPLFRLIDRMVPGARENARCIFNMRGLALPVTTVGHGEGLHYLDCWVGTSGWVLDHYWRHWRYTLDREFLAHRFYPLLREVCRFYLDYLQDDNGRLVIYPSQSPENRIPSRANSFHGLNSTFDLAIFRDVLERTSAAADILGIADEVANEAKAALPRLAHFPTAPDGRLREMEDHEFQRGHRHFSHLYPVFPSGRIGIDGGAARRGAIMAMDAFERWPTTGQAEWFARVGYGAWAGWTYPVMACTFARLGLGERALRAMEAFSQAFSYPSGLARCFERDDLGFGIHASADIGQWIEIDSSCAVTAAVQELLLQSHGNVLRLLPALPRQWHDGRFEGWLAEGGFEVAAEWQRGLLRHATVRSLLGQPCCLRVNPRWRLRVTSRGSPVQGQLRGRLLTIPTQPGQTIELQTS